MLDDLESLLNEDPSVRSLDSHYTGQDVDPGTPSIFSGSNHDAYVDQPALDIISAASAQSMGARLGASSSRSWTRASAASHP